MHRQTSEGAAETYALEQLRTGAVAPLPARCITIAASPAGRARGVEPIPWLLRAGADSRSDASASFLSLAGALVSYMLIPERGYA